jgi:hypothetical protein
VQAVACHGNEFSWPILSHILCFSCSHDDSTSERKSVILQKFVFLQTLFGEDFGIVSDGISMVAVLLGVQGGRSLAIATLYSV